MRAVMEPDAARRTTRLAAILCLVAAIGSLLIGGIALHAFVPALMLALGLAAGSLNGMVAGKLLFTGLPFFATSMARLMALTICGLAVGMIVGFRSAWLLILGVGVAQLLLAGAAVREAVRR